MADLSVNDNVGIVFKNGYPLPHKLLITREWTNNRNVFDGSADTSGDCIDIYHYDDNSEELGTWSLRLSEVPTLIDALQRFVDGPRG